MATKHALVCGEGIKQYAEGTVQEKMQMVLNRSFSKPSDVERCVVWLMVKDGVDLDTITPSSVRQLIRDMISMMDECNSLEEAYMRCVH